MGIELEPNQGGCFEARQLGCTCIWLRGFGVDERNINDWVERILERDPECVIITHR